MACAIIFDLEGVIIDTESHWDKEAQIFLGRRGFEYDRARIKHLLTGKSLAEAAAVMQKEYGFKGDPEELGKERMAIMTALLQEEIAYVSGFEQFYASVKDMYKTAVGTAMNEHLFPIVDKKLGLTALFNGHVYKISDVGNRSKPDPAIFLYAARKLHTHPKDCIVIEDSPFGIDAAKSAGMRCIGLATTYPASILKDADIVVRAYSEICLQRLS